MSSVGSSPPISVGPSDPVNVQKGFCAQVGGSRILREDEGRTLAAGSSTTSVTLTVTACNAAVDESSYAMPASLQAKLAAIGVGATPPPGSSPSPSPPPAAFLSVRKRVCSLS